MSGVSARIGASEKASACCSGMSADCVTERYGAFESAELCGETIGPQQIPDPAACAHDLKRDSTRGELIVESIQHAGAGKIEMRRGGQIADHRADSRVRLHLGHDGLQ